MIAAAFEDEEAGPERTMPTAMTGSPSAPGPLGRPNPWGAYEGDPGVVIAVLDGPVDLGHSAFAGGRVRDIPGFGGAADAADPAAQHGTHVASLIFGRRAGPAPGVAPGCSGLVVPVFRGVPGVGPPSCSEVELAMAIGLALEGGADVINVSGGRLLPSGEPHPQLAEAVRRCVHRGVLVVAAVGNDGCRCLHVPAAIPGVLAVGAVDSSGRPLSTNNWHPVYGPRCLLAPGEGLIGAVPGGGTARKSGTSCAAAVASGVVGLLLSVARRHGRRPTATEVGTLLLDLADRSEYVPSAGEGRHFARLNLDRLRPPTNSAGHTMSLPNPGDQILSPTPTGGRVGLLDEEGRVADAGLRPSEAEDHTHARAAVGGDPAVRPSGCGCTACSSPRRPAPLVFALGELGFDLVSEARRDSIRQNAPEGIDPTDPAGLLAYLGANPWEAASITWTLLVDGLPVYAIRPAGPFAAESYGRLREFLADRVGGRIERVSVPGRVVGTTTLFDGRTVPTIEPELRGMYSWTTAALVDAVAGPAPDADAASEPQRREHGAKVAGVRNFLDRVYFALRNLGVTSEERAINFAATNALLIGDVFGAAIRDEMELDAIHTGRSPICRPESDCWDVKLTFFYPQRQVQAVRRAYRFTVDVSDVVPVTVGPMRSWFER